MSETGLRRSSASELISFMLDNDMLMRVADKRGKYKFSF